MKTCAPHTFVALALVGCSAGCSPGPARERPQPTGERVTIDGAPHHSSPGTPAPKRAPPPTEKHVIQVKNLDELQKLRDQYLEALASGSETLFEVEIAPGTYGPANISLAVPAGQRIPDEMHIDIVLRGKAGGDAVVLNDAALQLTGRSVRVENLVFSGAKNTVLKVQAYRDVVVEGCAVVGNRWASDYAGVTLVDVLGLGKTPLEVTVADSWFVGNRQTHDKKKSTVVQVKRAIHAPLSEVVLRSSTFVGNDVATEVAISGASAVRLEDVLVHRTRTAGVFLDCDACRRTELEGVGLVVETLDAVAALTNSGNVTVRHSRLYPREKMALPDSLDGEASQIRERSSLKGWDEVVEEVLGVTGMPDKALRAKLEKALGGK